MVETPTRILRSSEVEIDGRLQVGLGLPGSARKNDTRPASAQTQVRIVEKQNDFAIIEFTCSCGQKTQIKCTFAQPQQKTNPNLQKDVPKATNAPR